MAEATIFSIVLLAVTAIIVGAMVTRSVERTRERHLLHQERMVALQKSELSREEVSRLFAPPAQRNSTPLSWIRLFSVGLGLIFAFGGSALLAGLILVNDGEVSQFWGLGLVPAMIGLGLLLFALVSGLQAFRLADTHASVAPRGAEGGALGEDGAP